MSGTRAFCLRPAYVFACVLGRVLGRVFRCGIDRVIGLEPIDFGAVQDRLWRRGLGACVKPFGKPHTKGDEKRHQDKAQGDLCHDLTHQ